MHWLPNSIEIVKSTHKKRIGIEFEIDSTVTPTKNGKTVVTVRGPPKAIELKDA